MQEAPEEVSSTLPVSVDEQRALDLYDKLQELRLEIAIINAQKSLQGGKGRVLVDEIDLLSGDQQ